jgi:2-C-methyl-D-erythritol 4-phosphate cytidylyltransferase/2-C-methyl-D-erythritol 2,4-cyclodiphosphate synthase
VSAGVETIIVVIPAGCEAFAQAALTGTDVDLITGGDTRQASVRAGLEALRTNEPAFVLIHDAARPGLPGGVIERLVTALEMSDGAIPVLPVIDSLAAATGDRMAAPARREDLRRVQTPQAFRYAPILAAHRAWVGEDAAGDDAQVAHAHGLSIALVEGDEALAKLTYPSDFEQDAPAVRMGTGYDVHRLAPGEELWLCGVRIEHDKGLAGHSDADVAIHALVDAILGALGAGDIGEHFPPSDPQWRGASSDQFLAHAMRLAADAGYAIGNVDLTLICEAPKLSPHRAAMRERLADLLGCNVSRVSVKATTTEGLGFTGRGEGIAAQAAAVLVQSAP